MPKTYLEERKDDYLKLLKDHLGFSTSKQYLQILTAFDVAEVTQSFGFYYPFLKELAQSYTKFSKRMKFDEVCDTLKIFAIVGLKSPTLYNQILTDIGRIFHLLRATDITNVLESFAKLKMKQVSDPGKIGPNFKSDLFDKITLKIQQDSVSFSGKQRQILEYFFSVGYDSDLIKEKFEKIFLGKKQRASSKNFGLTNSQSYGNQVPIDFAS